MCAKLIKNNPSKGVMADPNDYSVLLDLNFDRKRYDYYSKLYPKKNISDLKEASAFYSILKEQYTNCWLAYSSQDFNGRPGSLGDVGALTAAISATEDLITAAHTKQVSLTPREIAFLQGLNNGDPTGIGYKAMLKTKPHN